MPHKVIRAEVKPGGCGQTTIIWAEAKPDMVVHVRAESTCPMVSRLVDALPDLNAYEELFKPLCDIVVFRLASHYLSHRACMVPVTILKAVEAAADLALPVDIDISLSVMDPA